MSKKYPLIGLGGTFDYFHLGHEKFIRFASQLGEKLSIGITTNKLNLSKTDSHLIQSYFQRDKAIKRFCRENGIEARSLELTDVYGPTLDNSQVKALAVTKETVDGATKINQLREKLKLPKLPVFVCDMHLDESGQVLSSELIRAGQVNRKGQVYDSILKKTLKLNSSQRSFCTKPLGEVVSKPLDHNQVLVCVVGDTSLEKFIENNWCYDLGVYDKRRERKSVTSKIIDKITPDLKTLSPAGSISLHLTKALKTSLKNNHKHLFVNGEEDLAAVALVLLAPLQTVIYYGQPDGGLIAMEVTEKLKNEFYQQFS